MSRLTARARYARLCAETANERSNDSAIRQILRLRFKPAVKDGLAVQAEGILTFDLNTRASGPANALTDAEVRNWQQTLWRRWLHQARFRQHGLQDVAFG